MRTIPSTLWDLWAQGGPLIGDDGAPHGRVTLETNWYLHTSTECGNWPVNKKPVRWWQREDNSQAETELPNVKSISIDRSIDSDAASATITIYNQWMDGNEAGSNTELGNPGHFTWDRGESFEAEARWNHAPNEWSSILIPNALIRTYQGYGGRSKTIANAIADGNIVLTGVWLVDEVKVSTNGMLEIRCRDMAKLLIDQHLYPPLVPPKPTYPLDYCRWIYDTVKFKFQTVTKSVGGRAIIPARFADSSVDRWYPSSSPGSAIPSGGYVLHGHQGDDCLDGNTGTYCLSVGNSHPSRPFCADWWEFDVGGANLNAVYIHPWAGNYTMFVSIKIAGRWQGTSVVPYSADPLYGTQDYVVDTGADIPYVASFGVPWEQAKDYVLPQMYSQVERVRITFRDHTYSGIGPWMYRCGMREFRALTTSVTQTIVPAWETIDNKATGSGYWTMSLRGEVSAFGDARNYGNATTSTGDRQWLAIEGTKTGNGYYLLSGDGQIEAKGDAVYYGEPGAKPPGGGFWYSMCVTHTGLGYWVAGTDGSLRSFGDAPTYSGISGAITDIESHPSGYGVWIFSTTGTVTVRGAANHYGNMSDVGHQANAISVTPNGDGYWLLNNEGRVEAKGTATNFGNVNDTTRWWTETAVSPGGTGLWVLSQDGHVVYLGDADMWGQPADGSGIKRSDGNYTDYTDIIRDLLLWAGWWLYDSTPDLTARPTVYGNLETTGAYSEECLPPDLFDKRPVIDAITAIKEIVGYIFWIDDEGAARFESPNWWAAGNFLEDGTHTDFIPEIDELTVLTNHAVSFNDKNVRSEVIISTEDPTEGFEETITTRYRPASRKLLRGMVRPAMWVNGYFTNRDEQRIMAELIALHIWFQLRQANTTCLANPAIQINDQVRIYERQTGETYIHYVRGIQSNMDLDTGRWTMDLSTHWLGSHEVWAITSEDADLSGDDQFWDRRFLISPILIEWLRDQESRSTTVGRAIFDEYGSSALTQMAPHDPDVIPTDGTGTGTL